MKEINIEELKFNPFAKIGKEWFLITAGNKDSFNTMTASWGFMGVMWGRNCIQAVVRPTRHTYKFLTENDNFTVSFFSEKCTYRKKHFTNRRSYTFEKTQKFHIIPLHRRYLQRL